MSEHTDEMLRRQTLMRASVLAFVGHRYGGERPSERAQRSSPVAADWLSCALCAVNSSELGEITARTAHEKRTGSKSRALVTSDPTSVGKDAANDL